MRHACEDHSGTGVKRRYFKDKNHFSIVNARKATGPCCVCRHCVLDYGALSHDRPPASNRQDNQRAGMLSRTLLAEVQPPLSIRVGGSSVHGNGVFATKDFIAGEIIEKAPLLHVPGGSMLNYVFRSEALGCNYLALGYGSIYNHSDDCNAKVSTNYHRVRNKDGGGHDLRRATFRVIAVKPIGAGSEITIDYRPRYNWKRKCFHR